MIHGEPKTTEVRDVKNVFLLSMISGAAAGLICDIVFFPLDTLKTRLQSQHGFVQSGGFKKMYQGVAPVIIGSAPSGKTLPDCISRFSVPRTIRQFEIAADFFTASLFFVTYEGFKEFTQPLLPVQYHSFIHMTAACMGEAMACLVRVPVEVMKQRKQAFLQDTHKLALRTLYRGYGSTVLRDMPFGLMQMPMWEYLKLCWKRRVGRDCTPFEGATCGAGSVAVAAGLTTPLDVAKTRIMLSSTSADKAEVKIGVMLKEVYRESGTRGLFAGFSPRVGGFTLGGFVFFGVYEQVRALCSPFLPCTVSRTT